MILTPQIHANIGMTLLFLTWYLFLQDRFIDEFYNKDSDTISLLKKGTVIFSILCIINALYYWIITYGVAV
jgi:hypothetical protein